jgi:hypothetical protein
MANKKISQLTVASALTGTEVLPVVQSGQTVKTTTQEIADLASGLSGTNYVFVQANETPEENGVELIAAYNTAKTMNPSSENRVTVIAAPGYYLLSSDLELDTEFVDLVSLDGNRSVIIDGINQPSNLYYFSDSPGGAGTTGYSISDGGNDMYDGANEIYADGNQIAYTHTQLPADQSRPNGLTPDRIGTFTYIANGTTASDNTYTQINGITDGQGSSASFNIEIIGGVATNVEIYDVNDPNVSFYSRGKDYAVNDTITILGSQIGGTDGIDDITITVTSLIGYFDINTSVVNNNNSISSITYTSSGSGLSDANYYRHQSSTSGTGKNALFLIEVTGGVVTNVTVYKSGYGYNINDTITILGSQFGGVDGIDDLVITVTNLIDYFNPNNIFTLNYQTFRASLNNQVGNNILNNSLVLHSIETDNYYLVNFSSWTQNGEGGGFSYTRQLITPEMDEPIISFTKTDYGDEVDIVEPNILEITRGENGGIYNTVLENHYDATTSDGISPLNTLWNNDGWDVLTNVSNRRYFSFYDALKGQIGNNIVGSELIMKDVTNNKYYKFNFTVWGNSNDGAPVTYTRQEINGTTGENIGDEVEFVKLGNDDPTLVNDQIDVDLTIARGNNQGIYNIALESSWSQDGDDEYTSPEGTEWSIINGNPSLNTSASSYFTNLYPGFFFMGAQNTEVDEFRIEGNLGADGNGFLNYSTFSQGGHQVYVKRVGGTSDPSVNHIIVVNPTDANQITQTVPNDTNDDEHVLTGLLAAGVTEIYHMVFAKSNGVTLSNNEISNIVSQFLTIRNASSDINQLLTNLNSDYENLTQQVVPVLPAGTISVITNDIFVKGIDVGVKNFKIGDDLSLLKVENCKGGVFSFGGDPTFGENPITVSGTFIDCTGGFRSFGTYGTASGTFTNCHGGFRSFGANGIASGTFTNCHGGFDSFGTYGTASGTFTNCIGGDYSFAGNGTASGTFTNCIGYDYSFGANGTASGTFTDCVGGYSSFGTYGTASGTFTNCQGGIGSFGTYGTASGTFTNCQTESQSFGKNGIASGIFTDCQSGIDSFGSQTTASGTFTNCTGGFGSFGGIGGTLSGKLYYCRLTEGTFQTLSGSGKIRACVDGNDLFIDSLDA